MSILQNPLKSLKNHNLDRLTWCQIGGRRQGALALKFLTLFLTRCFETFSSDCSSSILFETTVWNHFPGRLFETHFQNHCPRQAFTPFPVFSTFMWQVSGSMFFCCISRAWRGLRSGARWRSQNAIEFMIIDFHEYQNDVLDPRTQEITIRLNSSHGIQAIS